jgi:hypothetical protein
LALRGPTSSQLSDHFEAARNWVNELAQVPVIRMEWRDWTHRVHGRQRLPASVWLDSPQDALKFIGKTAQGERYQSLWAQTAAAQPALLEWLKRRPLRALELGDQWDCLLAVVEWMKAHPRPGIYVRQVDIPGVDTKFIESHRGVLAELFDKVLEASAIDATAISATHFSRRYGFLDKPIRIRFRVLDRELACLPGCEGQIDITLDAASFSTLSLPIEQVFITENEINFLAFPPAPKAIVLFGAGYGWEALALAAWLHHKALHYWGDIDTHGFAILDQLRNHFPHAKSFLMDRETLLAHRQYWVQEPEPVLRDLPRLTIEEAALFDELRLNRLQPRLRLEQERVAYGRVVEALRSMGFAG